jgi:hypothetical protein
MAKMLGEIIKGPCSTFGGPDDDGVQPDEGLAMYDDVSQRPEIFLDEQPSGTTGLARRLDAYNSHYIAMRWDYDEISKLELRETICLVRSPDTARAFWAYVADWGPGIESRIADISPGLMEDLGIETDDEIEIVVLPPKQEETS